MTVPVLSFPNGIHPPGEKDRTSKMEIKKISPKPGSIMVFPVSQHIGAPCEPLVEAGERVLIGQKIGDSPKPVSAPIHSSVSGTVKEIKDALTPKGNLCKSVFIENDGLEEGIKPRDQAPDSAIPAREETLRRIREAGVVGLGGAGFPTHIKLNPPPGKKIDTIIVNAAECEPYLTTDHRVMLEDSDRLVTGLEVILSLFPEAQGIIGIETNKPDAIEKMSSAIKGKSRIKVVGLVPKYPQGSEKQLMYACTKREVPSGGLPADIGCLVDNVDTVVAIARAVMLERPLIRRIVTLTGGCIARAGNYEVRLGMKISELIDAIGGFSEEPYKIISGGPMMGTSMYDLDVPIIKTSSAFLCFTEKEGKLPPERPCLRCGKCVDHCPMHLMPLELNYHAINHDEDQFIKNSGLDCLECGSCSFTCPAKRHLAQSIRAMRKDLMSRGKRA
ncbi:MAG: electron transport complex subunit RsxC [Clostridiales bacterium]|jgi:electron transport complex protein RnfC|nr:electron transport complex subunit RsxC [Clostridiales bacterium]